MIDFSPSKLRWFDSATYVQIKPDRATAARLKYMSIENCVGSEKTSVATYDKSSNNAQTLLCVP